MCEFTYLATSPSTLTQGGESTDHMLRLVTGLYDWSHDCVVLSTMQAVPYTQPLTPSLEYLTMTAL